MNHIKCSLSHPAFLLDENVDIRVGIFLKKIGCGVINCPKGIADEKVVEIVKEKHAILLTNDKDFTNSDLYKPSKDWGIIVFRIHPPQCERLIYAINNFLNGFQGAKMFGCIIILHELKIEVIAS